MEEKIVYLMRGLPSCGKSYTAIRLAGEQGVVLETDQYFYTHVGDNPEVYDYDRRRLPDAREWNFQRFCEAVQASRSPVVVDRGNGLNLETQRYANFAVEHGYQVQLREPESEWWQEIRVLLKYKQQTREILDQWAERLAEISRGTHRVPVTTIRSWMRNWKWDLTVEQILEYRE
jgi:hypothetical protein